jgi:hypothetical protein
VQVPTDWQLAYSRSHKRYYYFQQARRQSSFEVPAELDRCTAQVADLAAHTNVRVALAGTPAPVLPADYLRALKQVRAHPPAIHS